MTPEKSKDLVEGVNFLKKSASSLGLDGYFSIVLCKWIIPFSMYLSEYGSCHKFWENVVKQDRLEKIPYCVDFTDLFYGQNNLFLWEKTEEGFNYWENIIHKMYKELQLSGKGTKLVNI